MSMKIDVGPDGARRADLFWVDPFAIQVLDDLRGRRRPPGDGEIVAMATSLLDHTQLQPVNARRIEGNRLLLTAGFTRTAAARLIRTGFTDANGMVRKDEKFRIQVRVVDCNEQAAFVGNVIENCRRNATSPVDDAHNQQRMRDRYGMGDKEIAELYGDGGVARVSRLKGLLRLSDAQQKLVHDGAMSVDAALATLDLPEEDRATAFDEAAAGSRVTGARVRRQVRDHHLRDEPDEGHPADGQPMAPATAVPKRALTAKEVREFFEGLSKATDVADEAAWAKPIQKFAKDALAWLAGTRSDKALIKALNRLLAGTPEKEKEGE